MSEKPNPEGAVDSFQDPKTGETIFVIPRADENPEDAKRRVRADHGIGSPPIHNPGLGTAGGLKELVYNTVKELEAQGKDPEAASITAAKMRALLEQVFSAGSPNPITERTAYQSTPYRGMIPKTERKEAIADDGGNGDYGSILS